MVRYIIRRLLMIIPVIILVSLVVYTLIDMAPGDFVDAMITPEMSNEDIAELKAFYDLDKPMLYRYGKYMLNLIQGDLGVSVVNNEKVWDTFIYRLPNTLVLALIGLVVGAAVSIPLGINAAKRAGGIADNITTVFVVIGISMPVFWTALLLIQLFSFNLGWLSPSGGIKDGLTSFIMPGLCSSLALMARCTRQTRSSMLDVLRADYLRTARAKGVPENVVINKHALGNAMIPIITVIGNTIAYSLSGSVVIEQVFAWPGVGRMAVEALQMRDTPTVLGTVILTCIFYVVIQIFVDVAYAFADPRIKSRYVKAKKVKRVISEPAA